MDNNFVRFIPKILDVLKYYKPIDKYPLLKFCILSGMSYTAGHSGNGMVTLTWTFPESEHLYVRLVLSKTPFYWQTDYISFYVGDALYFLRITERS